MAARVLQVSFGKAVARRKRRIFYGMRRFSVYLACRKAGVVPWPLQQGLAVDGKLLAVPLRAGGKFVAVALHQPLGEYLVDLAA